MLRGAVVLGEHEVLLEKGLGLVWRGRALALVADPDEVVGVLHAQAQDAVVSPRLQQELVPRAVLVHPGHALVVLELAHDGPEPRRRTPVLAEVEALERAVEDRWVLHARGARAPAPGRGDGEVLCAGAHRVGSVRGVSRSGGFAHVNASEFVASRRVDQRLQLGAEAGVLDLQGGAAVLQASVFGVLGPLLGCGGPAAGRGEDVWVRMVHIVHIVRRPRALYTYIHAVYFDAHWLVFS